MDSCDDYGRRSVFLFKSPKETATDPYTEVLESAGFTTAVIPSLSFHFCNEEVLQSHIAALHMFSAIILTSPRAIEAVLNVSKGGHPSFADVTCFVVGNASAESAKQAGFIPQGQESGNAEVLADFILKHRNVNDRRPMLMPCSNLRREFIHEKLSKNDVSLTEVVAYETIPNKELQEILQKNLRRYGIPDYAVFFSPSCFQFAYPFITSQKLPLDEIKLVAIGPTTSKALKEHGYTPYSVCAKPEPNSLLQAL